MRKYNQLEKGISILLTFVILIHLSGCYTTKKMTTSEPPVSNKYNYIVHCGKTKSQILYVSISNEIISGRIASFKPIQGNSVHIFIPPDSGLNLKPGAEFSINLNKVSKIEIKEFSTVYTVLLGILGAAAIVVIIGLLTLDIDVNLDGW
jgi:hypothetical protein